MQRNMTGIDKWGLSLGPGAISSRLATGSQSVEYFPEADAAIVGNMKSLLAASSCDPNVSERGFNNA